MPTVTSLEVQKKNKRRVNVYLDGEFFAGMEAISALSCGLKVGSVVSEETLRAAVFDSEKTAAFEKAVDYLSRSMKTQKQIIDYLSERGFDREVVVAVVDKLQSYRYVDDQAYARLYAEQNSKTKGERRVRQELLQKGVCKEQAETSAAENGANDEQNAAQLAEKYMRGKQPDVKTLARLQRFLVSRGYDFDVVNPIVSRYRNQGEFETD